MSIFANKTVDMEMIMRPTCVIAGMYEDDPGLMNQEQYYSMKLHHPVLPGNELVVKEFFGTLEQVENLMDALIELPWAREYYASTIAAWEAYQAGDLGAVHGVGESFERLLTPVSEIARSRHLQEHVHWAYTDKYGAMIPAYADDVETEQVLLQDGNRYLRCARYWLNDVARVHSDYGWIVYDGKSRGIPEMLHAPFGGAISPRLFLVEEEYFNVADAMRDMLDNKFNYNQLSREMFSGC